MSPTVDNLTTLDRLKLWIMQYATQGVQIIQNNATEDFFLNMLITQVSNEITKSCFRTHFLLSNPINPITKAYPGPDEAFLVLDQWPIYTPILKGNTVVNSPVITGLSSTDYLFPNQSVTGPAFTPAQQTIQPQFGPLYIVSVDSPTQVTLNGNAASTTTQSPIGFGVAVWSNQTPWYGSAPGSFPTPSTMLAELGQYWIKRDQPDGTSKSAMLGRMYGLWQGWWQQQHYDLAPLELPGGDNYLVQAAIGYDRIPPDLDMACCWAAMKARFMRPWGLFLQSEHDDGYGYALGQVQHAVGSVFLGLLDGPIAATLARYRIQPFSTF